MTSESVMDPTGPGTIAGSWTTDAPYPLVVTGATGAIDYINIAAAEAFGLAVGDQPPTWMTAGGPDASVSALVEDRSYEVHAVTEDAQTAWWLVENTQSRHAQLALGGAAQRAEVLADVSATLLASLNPERCMMTTASLAAEHLAAIGIVVAPRRRGRFPVARCAQGGEPQLRELRIDPLEVVGLTEALRGFPPVDSRWIDPHDLPEWIFDDLDVDRANIGSVVVAPLPGHGVPAGALILLRESSDLVYTPEDDFFARVFTNRAGAALSAARAVSDHAQITDVLLGELLPPTVYRVHGVDLAGRYQPAQDAERVGGDFYDIHPARDASQETALVLGDVCGKGLDAAIMTGKVRNTLQTLLPMSQDHQRTLELLNRALINARSTRFVTLVLAGVRREGDRVHARLTSAGHLPPLVVRRDGTVEKVPTQGTLIGVLSQAPATTAEIELQPGESCLLYTDGVTEARGGPFGDAMFGEHRLAQTLAECALMPAQAMVERVHMVVSQWIGDGGHDDIALLGVTCPPWGAVDES